MVVLDTETTGLEAELGHRIIEIGAVELIERRPSGKTFHRYLNPDRRIDAEAMRVHGISDEFLLDKPRFADVAEELLGFLRDAEVVIHNAPFDVGFLDAEFARLVEWNVRLAEVATVIDTLPLARSRWPGQRNSLDALCKRLGVDNSGRELHGALLDAQLLADVYLTMTVGQGGFDFAVPDAVGTQMAPAVVAGKGQRAVLQLASGEEVAVHEAWLDEMDRNCDGGSVWRREQDSG